MPLSEVGATSASAIVWGLLMALAISPLLTRELVTFEGALAAHARGVRAVAVLLATGALVVSGAILLLAGHRFAVSCVSSALTCLGLVALGARLPTIPFWLPSLILVMALMVFGVNRNEQDPYRWAWLLSERDISWSELPATLVVAASGCLAYVVRSPRG